MHVMISTCNFHLKTLDNLTKYIMLNINDLERKQLHNETWVEFEWQGKWRQSVFHNYINT